MVTFQATLLILSPSLAGSLMAALVFWRTVRCGRL